MKLRIGTRKSDLAQTQSKTVLKQLADKGIQGELVLIDSSGDKDRKTPLYETDGSQPGVFTKELEDALIDGRIDLAVHSLKDLPTEVRTELMVAAVSVREDAGDTLLIHTEHSAPSLPLGIALGSRIGTSSLRREAQLLAVRPDLRVQPLRGNVPTRLKKVEKFEISATVLANAGLNRLKLDLSHVIAVSLSAELFVGAPGQGALGLETRTDVPPKLRKALSELNDAKASAETGLERKLLRELEGGCTLPFGARAKWLGNDLFELRAFLGIVEPNGDQAAVRKWLAFERFHGEGAEAGLIKEALAYFRGRMK